MKSINILFVCKYNRFRSRIAEAYFRKINKNKNIRVKSAGLIEGCLLNPVQLATARKFGLNISGKPKGLSTKLLKWQNLLVIVADDVPRTVFRNTPAEGKRKIVWKISDVKKNSVKEVEGIVRKIKKKVRKLVKELEENK